MRQELRAAVDLVVEAILSGEITASDLEPAAFGRGMGIHRSQVCEVDRAILLAGTRFEMTPCDPEADGRAERLVRRGYLWPRDRYGAEGYTTTEQGEAIAKGAR